MAAVLSGAQRGRLSGYGKRIAHLNREVFDRTRAARESALLSAIVDSSNDAILSKDPHGVIMSWNKGAERLFGFTPAEAVGNSIKIILPPDLLGEEEDILRRLAKGERFERLETVRMRIGYPS
jgi:PAS domain S-box-containing protein